MPVAAQDATPDTASVDHAAADDVQDSASLSTGIEDYMALAAPQAHESGHQAEPDADDAQGVDHYTRMADGPVWDAGHADVPPEQVLADLPGPEGHDVLTTDNDAPSPDQGTHVEIPPDDLHGIGDNNPHGGF